MNYIVAITISGSSMLLLYYLQKSVLGERLSKRWQYFFLKAVMVYYMVPVPFIGELYRKMIRSIFPLPSVEYIHYYHNEKVLFRAGNSYALNGGYKYRLLAAGLWCLIPLMILTVRLIRYRRMCKVMKRCRDTGKDTEYAAVIDELKDKWHIKRNVTLCICDQENIAFTVGLGKPVIVCSMPEDAIEKEMLLEHELVHVKRMDVLWKVAGTFVKMLHWFNPLVYVFGKEFDRICEVSCDEELVKGRGEEERDRYAVMLVKRSVKQEQVNGWRVAMAGEKLSKKGKWIFERAGMVMESKSRKNKWGNVVSVLLIGAMVMLNSLTALAYEETKVLSVNSEEAVRDEGAVDIEIFLGAGEDGWMEPVLYDAQFIDEEGNIYPIRVDQQNTYAVCNHTYVSGKLQKHNKKADGGCTVVLYECQYCSKCGNCIVGEWINSLSYAKCPH